MAVCQNLVPLVNIKMAGKWMFIPLKMVLIGIDPYPNHHESPVYQRVIIDQVVIIYHNPLLFSPDIHLWRGPVTSTSSILWIPWPIALNPWSPRRATKIPLESSWGNPGESTNQWVIIYDLSMYSMIIWCILWLSDVVMLMWFYIAKTKTSWRFPRIQFGNSVSVPQRWGCSNMMPSIFPIF